MNTSHGGLGTTLAYVFLGFQVLYFLYVHIRHRATVLVPKNIAAPNLPAAVGLAVYAISNSAQNPVCWYFSAYAACTFAIILVPIVTYNIVSNKSFLPNATVNILQSPLSLVGLVWISSVRNKLPVFGSTDGDFTAIVSHVIVGLIIIWNIMTN